MTACCRSGLLMLRMTLVGVTARRGGARCARRGRVVVAVIQRMFSGTSVPEPRTCRIIGPRLTVSTQTVARSTPGAAGRSRDTPTVMPTIATRATTA